MFGRAGGKTTALREALLQLQREDMCIVHSPTDRGTMFLGVKRLLKQHRPDAACVCGRGRPRRIPWAPGTIIRFDPIEAGNVTDPCTLNVNGYGVQEIQKVRPGIFKIRP